MSSHGGQAQTCTLGTAALHTREAVQVEGGCVLVGDGKDRVTVCVLLGGKSWTGGWVGTKAECGY